MVARHRHDFYCVGGAAGWERWECRICRRSTFPSIFGFLWPLALERVWPARFGCAPLDEPVVIDQPELREVEPTKDLCPACGGDLALGPHVHGGLWYRAVRPPDPAARPAGLPLPRRR